jgi:hypothetical protein
MPGKSKSDIGIFIVNQLPQSGIAQQYFNGTEQERVIHVAWERELRLYL